jgi:predicted dehydrogenase
MSLRVAVIGVGYLGQHHARIFSELQDVELFGVVDTDRERAETVAQKYRSQAFPNYKDVVGEVDALSIAVPTSHHFEIALDCLRKGKDVLVEKPIASTASEADELVREAEKSGRILQVGHLERYNPGVMALSRMIDRPRLFEAVRFSPFLNRGCDVDVTVDLMIHDIEIVLSLISSPVKNMKAFGFSLMTDKIDEARVWMEFENGAMAYLSASRVSREKKRKLRVYQKDLYMELDYQTGEVELRPLKKPLKSEIIRPEYVEPLKEELKDFVSCVQRREQPKVSGAEGRDALKIALEINELMERHS